MAEIDMEKIIKGLKLCVVTGDFCGECPYDDEMELCIDKLHDDALTLLKEQEAKNVIAEKRKTLIDDSYDEAVYCEDTFYHCPSCNRNLSRTHMDKDIHFCSSCGQEVKWNG